MTVKELEKEVKEIKQNIDDLNKKVDSLINKSKDDVSEMINDTLKLFVAVILGAIGEILINDYFITKNYEVLGESIIALMGFAFFLVFLIYLGTNRFPQWLKNRRNKPKLTTVKGKA